MAIETPPPVTPAPQPYPQRGERSTFSDRVDAFVAWFTTTAIPQMAALVLNVYNNAVAAFNAAMTATAQADAAVSAVNAPVWVSGTTYAIGNARYSPLNGRTYRRRTAGAGTTDPALDPTNWDPVTLQALTTATRSSAFTAGLAERATLQVCTGTFTLSFTSAATLANGWFMSIQNAGTGIITLDPAGAETIQGLATYALHPGASVDVISNGTNLLALNYNNAGFNRIDTVLPAAAALDLRSAAYSDVIHVTGNTSITSILLGLGVQKTLVFDGSPLVVAGPNIATVTGGSFNAWPGASVRVVGDTGGARLIAQGVRASGMELVASYDVAGSPTSIDFLTLFSTLGATYDSYVIEVLDIAATTGAGVQMRFAVGGTVDTGTNYSGQMTPAATGSGTANASMVVVGVMSTLGRGGNATIEVRNVNSAAGAVTVEARATYMNAATTFISLWVAYGYVPVGPVSGFSLSGGTYSRGNVRVYGKRKY